MAPDAFDIPGGVEERVRARIERARELAAQKTKDRHDRAVRRHFGVEARNRAKAARMGT